MIIFYFEWRDSEGRGGGAMVRGLKKRGVVNRRADSEGEDGEGDGKGDWQIVKGRMDDKGEEGGKGEGG